MNFKKNETEQKLRGGYYTPEPVARFLVQWAINDTTRNILEPSCGDGSFLHALGVAIKAKRMEPAFSVDAVELMVEESQKAEIHADALRTAGVSVTLDTKDFFSWITNGKAVSRWDAIIGNPPYIRYQYFDKDQRDIAESIFEKAGLRFTKRTNAWVPFLIASVLHLNPQGRLAMVVPAEILHIQHAGGLRLLLEQEMESVAIVSLRDMIFENVLQGVVLLLGVKRAMPPATEISLFNQHQAPTPTKTDLQIIDIEGVRHLDDLKIGVSAQAKQPIAYHGDWMKALLTPEEIDLLDKITTSPAVPEFKQVADVDIGIVTGANDFFVVDEETLHRYHLEEIAAPMLAKSDLIKGITYTLEDHACNAQRGRSVHFLSFPHLPLSELPDGMTQYIRMGEEEDLHTRYKCRIRSPWYVVPYVWSSELSLLKRCHHYPRIVLNEADAYSTDTAYRMKMRPAFKQRATDLTFSFLNSLSFLYAEMLGRHYGGGVLELVPSEIERIPIPLTQVNTEDFRSVDQMIRGGTQMSEVLDFTDERILRGELGLGHTEICMIRSAHLRLMKRRLRQD